MVNCRKSSGIDHQENVPSIVRDVLIGPGGIEMERLPLNVDFSEKVVVVTGAGGVLCGDMAKAFAQAGAKVAALDLNEEAVKKLAEDC